MVVGRQGLVVARRHGAVAQPVDISANTAMAQEDRGKDQRVADMGRLLLKVVCADRYPAPVSA